MTTTSMSNTFTVLENNAGKNETLDIAPGRGGYSTVIIPMPPEEAVVWWEERFGKEPDRIEMPYPESEPREAWNISEALNEEQARKHCGEMTLDQGGIGSPMKRYYTWDELRGRLDVWVVGADEV